MRTRKPYRLFGPERARTTGFWRAFTSTNVKAMFTAARLTASAMDPSVLPMRAGDLRAPVMGDVAGYGVQNDSDAGARMVTFVPS